MFRSALLLGGLAAFVAGAILPAPCFAAPLPTKQQADARVHLTPAQAADLPVALGAIAQQARVAILVEGRPFHLRLAPDKAAPLAPDAPLDTFVDRLAAAYDYAVLRSPRASGLPTRRQRAVFVLQKKYTDPRDMPSLTTDECLRCVRRYKECLNVFNPASIPSNTETLQNIYRSLRPEQIDAMRADRLVVASLSPDQKARLQPLMMKLYTGTESNKVRQDTERIEAARDATLYNELLASDNMIHYGYYSGADKKRNASIGSSMNVPAAPDPDPALDGNLPRDGEAQPTTFAAFGDWLNQQTPAGGASYAIDEVLAKKPFWMARRENADPAALFAALQDMHSLRVMQGTSAKQRLLTTAFAPLPRTLSDLPLALRRTLPDALQRAMHDDRRAQLEPIVQEARRIIAKYPQNEPATPEELEARRVGDKALTELSAIDNAPLTRTHYALSFLLTRAAEKQAEEARVSAASVVLKDPKAVKLLVDRNGVAAAPLHMPLSKLGPYAEEYLVAATMFAIAYTTTTQFRREAPPYVSDPDSMYLVGRVYDKNGQSMLAMHFGIKDPKTGKVTLVSGIFDVKAPAP